MPSCLTPQFSIVIPVHNGADYIAQTLESVFAQTYSAFNVIILENCSSDNTLPIVNRYTDSRLQVLPSSRPLAIEDNWARILDLSLNEYLVLLCHDDLLHPNFLNEIARLIQAEPTASLYHSQLEIIDSDGTFLYTAAFVPYKETGEEFLLNLHRGGEYVIASGWVMRSQDFKKVGGMPKFQKLNRADFYCFYLLANLSYAVCSPLALCRFRFHKASAGFSSNPLDICIASQQYLQALSDTPIAASADHMRLIQKHLNSSLAIRYALYLLTILPHSEPDTVMKMVTMREQLLDLANNPPELDFYRFWHRGLEFTVTGLSRSLRLVVYKLLLRLLEAKRSNFRK